jgi:antitoxin component YwqK of YwqJK toxin-antitoxin module
MKLEKKGYKIDESLNEEIIKLSLRDSLDADNYKKEKESGCFKSFLILYIGTALSCLPYLIAVNSDLIFFDFGNLFFSGLLTFVIFFIAYSVYENIYKKFTIKYFRSDVIQEEGVLRWGKRSGHWHEYYIDGSIMRNSYYVKGDLRYVEKFYSTGITEEVINYKNGREHGFYYYYHENGNLREISHFICGRRHGPYHKYFKGELLEETGRYNDGELDGIVYTFFENRRVETVERLSNGILHGKKTEYYEDGAISSIIDYANGKLNGIHKEFDKQGVLICHRLYQNGSLLHNFISN